MITLKKSDALFLLNEIPSNSIDMVFTDPPYWTLDEHRKTGTTTRLSKWFDTVNTLYLEQLIIEFFRVLKYGTHAFVMSDGQTLPDVINHAKKAGFNYCKPLVWDKQSIGMGYHFRCQHEYIVMLDKGKNRKPKDLTLPDILSFKMIKNGYPTEKPTSLINLFIEQFTEEGETVLDPFSGSGAVAVVCAHKNRHFIGCDISEHAIEYANNRINNLFSEAQ